MVHMTHGLLVLRLDMLLVVASTQHVVTATGIPVVVLLLVAGRVPKVVLAGVGLVRVRHALSGSEVEGQAFRVVFAALLAGLEDAERAVY